MKVVIGSVRYDRKDIISAKDETCDFTEMFLNHILDDRSYLCDTYSNRKKVELLAKMHNVQVVWFNGVKGKSRN